MGWGRGKSGEGKGLKGWGAWGWIWGWRNHENMMRIYDHRGGLHGILQLVPHFLLGI